MTHSG